ncbi:glucokinase [Paludibacterium paludis]|uniref:Glucokinase n=1 Tax=Paludibacterium paludis TaxID=1225769 RepID=A0A918NYR3_9NEIS|nr:glucokinase [Paludibacterium paludis]GGY04890.1 glucokinase [Paludibacterium paludis]
MRKADAAGARLVADIGGTHARFALSVAPGVLDRVQVLSCADHPSLEAAVRAYLAGEDMPRVEHAAIGIATAVLGDAVAMTNHHWAFSIEATRRALGLSTLLVINDFTALALALPHLGGDSLVQVGGGEPVPGAPVALIGPGTGLGVSALIPHAGGHAPIAGEGGHAAFAPCDEREIAVWRHARERFGRVSVERLLSGSGLSVIHRALCERAGEHAADALEASAIVGRALDGGCERSAETLEVFLGMLGTAAANLALTFGAQGGVYVGGGIVPRLLGVIGASPFRARFEDAGRFAGYLASIPVFVITGRHPALTGAAAALGAHLENRHYA